MTREEARRENARTLAAGVGGLAEFGRKTEMEPSQVSQLIGKTPSKNIGNIIAKRIESAFGKEAGWLDVPHAPNSAPTEEVEQDRDGVRGEPVVAAVESLGGPVAAPTSAMNEMALQWNSPDEVQLLTQYRAATAGWKKAIQKYVLDAEKDPSVTIVRNKS